MMRRDGAARVKPGEFGFGNYFGPQFGWTGISVLTSKMTTRSPSVECDDFYFIASIKSLSLRRHCVKKLSKRV